MAILCKGRYYYFRARGCTDTKVRAASDGVDSGTIFRSLGDIEYKDESTWSDDAQRDEAGQSA